MEIPGVSDLPTRECFNDDTLKCDERGPRIFHSNITYFEQCGKLFKTAEAGIRDRVVYVELLTVAYHRGALLVVQIGDWSGMGRSIYQTCRVSR